MSESKNNADTEVLQEIERLREENSQLVDDMLVYTGLPGQVSPATCQDQATKKVS
jgi:hypothetical protein